MDDIAWSNHRYDQWLQDQGQGVQGQGNQLIQVQEVQERRYPVRKRRRTEKAAALVRK
jgi:hypothetical protein